jgi:Na+/proline symporter
VSDIGILNHPSDIFFIALILGSPGLAIGALVGALAWKRHRLWGAVLGLLPGWALWLLGWLYFTDNL